MPISIVYFVAFVLGLFTVWRLGRERGYAEEKIIDMILLSLVVAVSIARFAYFLIPAGAVEWSRITSLPNIFFQLFGLLQLQGGIVVWLGIWVFIVMIVAMLWFFQWAQWPMIGISILGLGVFIIVSEISFLAIGYGLQASGLLLLGMLLVEVFLVYFISFKGDQKLVELYRKIANRNKKTPESK